MLWRYMGGAVAARTGDEMSGPALLVTGLAVTGSPVAASWLLAGLTVSAAVGGPLLGVLLDRARRPGRLLACCLAGYAAGLLLVLSGLGRVPEAALVGVAVATGLLGPALTGGWTAQLPLVTAPGRLGRATALDAMTYNVAGLAGPAVVGALAAVGGATTAVLACVALLAAALPIAWA
ncbi:MFS transporter, partial [Nonomuraea mesophila]